MHEYGNLYRQYILEKFGGVTPRLLLWIADLLNRFKINYDGNRTRDLYDHRVWPVRLRPHYIEHQLYFDFVDNDGKNLVNPIYIKNSNIHV